MSTNTGFKPLFIDYREHIIQCEMMIENFVSPKNKINFGFESFRNKLTENKRLLDQLQTEKKKDPTNLALHLSFDTAIDSLKDNHKFLQLCLLNKKDELKKLKQSENSYSAPRPRL